MNTVVIFSSGLNSIMNCNFDMTFQSEMVKEINCALQVKSAMDAISECCKTGEGNLLDLAIKVQSCEVYRHFDILRFTFIFSLNCYPLKLVEFETKISL